MALQTSYVTSKVCKYHCSKACESSENAAHLFNVTSRNKQRGNWGNSLTSSIGNRPIECYEIRITKYPNVLKMLVWPTEEFGLSNVRIIETAL